MKKIFVFFVFAAALFGSCATQSVDFSSKNLYADLLSFNSDIKRFYEQETSAPFDLNTPAGMAAFEDNVKKAFEYCDGETALYYAIDKAADRVSKFAKQNKAVKNARYYLIFLTDGLDNVSIEVARQKKERNWKSTEKYVAAISKKLSRILTSAIKEKSFQSWPILVYSEDATKGYSTGELVKILKPMAAGQNAAAPGPIITKQYSEIGREFEKNFKTFYAFSIPKGYLGKRIRMEATFKNKDDEKIQAALEADFSKKGGKCFIENIETFGMQFDETILKKGRLFCEKQPNGESSLSAEFKIAGLKDISGMPIVVVPDSTFEYYFENEKKRINSEYREVNAKDQSPVYIMFVLDTSKSIDPKSAQDAQKAVADIVTIIKDAFSWQ